MEDLYVFNLEHDEVFRKKNPMLYDVVLRMKSCAKMHYSNGVEFLALLSLIKSIFDVRKTVSYQKQKYTFFTFCETFLCLKRQTVSNYLSIASKFILTAGGNYEIDEKFKDFSITKLQELAVVDKQRLLSDIDCGLLAPHFSRERIRAYVKSLNCSNEPEKVENDCDVEIESGVEPRDISVEFDTSNEYSVDFFQKLEKHELVFCCMKYQIELLKIKGE